MNDTMFNILCTRAERICEDGVRLLDDFSGMYPVNKPGDSFVSISPSGNQFWDDLPEGGKQMQARLLPEIDKFCELIRAITCSLPDDAQQDLADALKQIRCAIDQSGTTWWKTRLEAVNGFRKLIDKILTILEEYFGKSVTEVLAIPDTNALLYNPDVEQWQFDGLGRFTLILIPTVLRELDNHKVNHRNLEVREKAEKLIRKIKEYRRRGSLETGVTVATNRISLRTFAREPNMTKTLSWFDSNIEDDRFLATVLEIIRANLSATIFVVTRDINMQNKAEMAGIPFREIPGQAVGLDG
jgi:rRNA-processing protein FCF1